MRRQLFWWKVWNSNMNAFFVMVLPSVLFVICLVAGIEISKGRKRKNFHQAMRSWEKSAAVKKDMFQSYSSKNKECFEHEAKESINDPKPKKKWNLWNEPSWDDELR